MEGLEDIILGRKGGNTSLKIIRILLDTPCNINQIAKIMNINYSTADYHIKFLVKNEILVKKSEGYGALYMVASTLKKNIEKYNDVKRELEKRINMIEEADNNDK